MTYDDRLTGHDDTESLLDAAEEIVEELAEQHFEECYPEGSCTACVRDTPLSKEQARWVPKATTVEDLIGAVEDRLEAMGDDPFWVYGELTQLYLAAFRGEGCEPQDCPVCNRRIVGPDDGCGHTQMGRDCPAR